MVGRPSGLRITSLISYQIFYFLNRYVLLVALIGM
jgi:hypothetical protein